MKILKNSLEIIAKNGDVHFRRFAIFETKYMSLYFHRIYKGDKDIYLHSHPWNFLSVILKGSYIEGTEGKDRTKRFLTPSWGTRSKFHKIKEIMKGPVWSLFLTFGRKRIWYYLVNGEKIDFTRFREIKHLPEYSYLFSA